MKIASLLLFLGLGLSLAAREPVSVTRSAGDYRVTVTLRDSTPLRIASIVVQHARQKIELPSSLFDDITAPHLGDSYKPAAFQVEAKQTKLFIRIKTDGGRYTDDHALILTLPLKEASRITRIGDRMAYFESRPSTPIVK